MPDRFNRQQRKEVQQAIERGMTTIRAQARSKNREQEKEVKQLQKQLDNKGDNIDTTAEASDSKSRVNEVLPWGLLLISWIGMAAYLWMFV